jgi:putative iron-only hydrogenase system regulator
MKKERRIGAAIILVEDEVHVPSLNKILSEHSHLIIGRQGIPLRDRRLSIISLVLEGNTDELGSLTGQIGRLQGIRIKSVLAS